MPFDFSSDLDMGRGPELKSDEKSKGIPMIVEIWHEVFEYFSVHVYTFSEHQSVARNRKPGLSNAPRLGS